MWNLVSPLSDTLESITPASGSEASPLSRNGFKRKFPAFETESCPPRAFRLPPPVLEVDFRLVCKLSGTLSIVPNAPGSGNRNWVRLDGGHFKGTWGSGVVIPGGQDKQTVESDLSTHSDTQHLLQTDDGAIIEVHMDGWRAVGTGGHGPLERLLNEELAGSVDPAGYNMRSYIYMQTGDERYIALNTAMWVASGARLADRIVYDAYRVLEMGQPVYGYTEYRLLI
jgi:hypothetical protein